MLSISQNKIISLSRGDSCKMPLFINNGTAIAPIRYNLNDHKEAVIYFSLMEPNRYFEQGFVKRVYNKDNWNLTKQGDLIIEFTPQDTMYIMPGKYFYEIKADLDGTGNNINTIIQKTEFWIR